MNRTRQIFEQELLSKKQAGFRKDIQVHLNILFTLQILFENVIETNQQTSIICFDCSKAYDRVNHTQLFDTTKDMGFPPHSNYTATISDQQDIIRWNNENGSYFEIQRGMRDRFLNNWRTSC